MPEFAYIARDTAGEKVSGTVAATGQREAMAALAGQALFPIEIRPEAGAVDDRKVGRIPAQLLATTYGQLADLLQSGVPLLRALDVLQRQTSHVRLKHVLGQIQHQIEEGATLADAMSRYRRVFGDMVVSMVRAGGEGGFLEEALSRVAEFTEAQEDIRKRTLGAVIYPLFLMVVGFIVVIVLVVFFVPMFSTMFSELEARGELPLPTVILLWISAQAWYFIPLMLGGLLGGFIYLKVRLDTDEGRLWWDRVRLRLPTIGPIFLNLAVARFCRVLGTLLHNGVPILRGLSISSEATANRVLAEAINDASENISAGEPLADPLAASGQFPPAVIEMIAVAEQANNLETVLLNIADGLERRTWRRLDLAVRLLEPILLLNLALIVLFVVVALLWPIFKIGTTAV